MMENNSLTLNVGAKLGGDDLLAALESQMDVLGPHLTWDVAKEDSRATADDDSVTLDSVEHIEGTTYDLSYHYDWSAFHGCKNADKSDTCFTSIRFEYRDGQAIFYFEPFEQRDTVEEY